MWCNSRRCWVKKRQEARHQAELLENSGYGYKEEELSDRLYENMNITGVTGLTEVTIATPKTLGAVELVVDCGFKPKVIGERKKIKRFLYKTTLSKIPKRLYLADLNNSNPKAVECILTINFLLSTCHLYTGRLRCKGFIFL